MTHPPCADCVFRRSALSIPAVMADMDLPIVDALAPTIAELEAWLNEQRIQELGTLQRIADEGLGADWPRRPKAHDHCGREAAQPRVMELANPSGGCPAHRAGQAPNRRCDTCRWLQRPRQAVLEIARLAGGSQASLQFARSAASVTEGLARNELMEAVKRDGVLPEPPRFLPVCTRVSRPGRAVVGPIVNWSRACGAWAPAAHASERSE